MPRWLIVNADDFNLTEGVTRGILEAHRSGIVTSTTVMVNLPGLEMSRVLSQAHPRLGLGLHLNLTFGPPVLPPGKVRSLVDDAGRFVRDHGRLREAGDPSEIRQELAAQVERFRAIFGHSPSHLDTHHHIHRHPPVLEAVLDLAVGLGVPVRAFTPEMAARIRWRPPVRGGSRGGRRRAGSLLDHRAPPGPSGDAPGRHHGAHMPSRVCGRCTFGQ